MDSTTHVKLPRRVLRILDVGPGWFDGVGGLRISPSITPVSFLHSRPTYRVRSASLKPELEQFDPDGGTDNSTVTWNDRDAAVGWEPETFTDGDTTTVYGVTNHCANSMGGTMSLTVDDKDSTAIDEGASSGHLDHEPSGGLITSPHITGNRIHVEFECPRSRRSTRHNRGADRRLPLSEFVPELCKAVGEVFPAEDPDVVRVIVE